MIAPVLTRPRPGIRAARRSCSRLPEYRRRTRPTGPRPTARDMSASACALLRSRGRTAPSGTPAAARCARRYRSVRGRRPSRATRRDRRAGPRRRRLRDRIAQDPAAATGKNRAQRERRTEPEKGCVNPLSRLSRGQDIPTKRPPAAVREADARKSFHFHDRTVTRRPRSTYPSAPPSAAAACRFSGSAILPSPIARGVVPVQRRTARVRAGALA